MPRLDRTGPMGQGQKTGRGLGPCGLDLGRGWFLRAAMVMGLGDSFLLKTICSGRKKMLEEELTAFAKK